jgi:hypothetical protein
MLLFYFAVSQLDRKSTAQGALVDCARRSAMWGVTLTRMAPDPG